MNSDVVIDKPASVVERIAVAVRQADITSEALRALFDEAATLRSGMMEAEADCMKQSLDPGNTVAEARTARESALDFAHEGKRLEVALAKIDEALPDVLAAERRARILPAYEKWRDERAAFIERLRDRWPKLTSEMVSLLEEIQRFDQSPPCEIPDGCDPLRTSVEAEARGCWGNFHVDLPGMPGIRPVPRFRDARLPGFEPLADGRGWAWSPDNIRHW